MTRGEAIRLAKSQKQGYVALLELRSDTMGPVRSSSNNYNDFYLEYSVFAPETAKIVTSGSIYQRVYSNGGVITRPTPGVTSAIYAEQLLRRAARDAANRMLAALHLVVPQGRNP